MSNPLSQVARAGSKRKSTREDEQDFNFKDMMKMAMLQRQLESEDCRREEQLRREHEDRLRRDEEDCHREEQLRREHKDRLRRDEEDRHREQQLRREHEDRLRRNEEDRCREDQHRREHENRLQREEETRLRHEESRQNHQIMQQMFAMAIAMQQPRHQNKFAILAPPTSNTSRTQLIANPDANRNSHDDNGLHDNEE